MVITQILRNRDQRVESETAMHREIDPTSSLYGCSPSGTADGGVEIRIVDEDEFGNEAIMIIVLEKTDIDTLKKLALI
jgi:hypothetical protein